MLFMIPMMNKLAIFSAIAGSAVLMTGIITGLQLLQIQEASAATNNCSRNVVGACVATDDVARNALRNSQVCVNVNVIAENNPGCRR
jgi:hypothetical protein